jgi:hypothetical protein
MRDISRPGRVSGAETREDAMRARRWIVVGFVLGACLALPIEAAADGGAYIEFTRTYYVQGGLSAGQAFVSVPENQQDIFERGPFFAYLLPNQRSLQEGRPLPEGTIRLGTFAIEDLRRETFALRVTFVVPEVESGMYTVQVCNDPCTISGFREPLSGSMTIARTDAEANLIRERDMLEWRVSSFRYRLGKADRKNEELQTQLDTALADLHDLSVRFASLQREDQAVPIAAPVADDGRPLVEGWALLAIIVAMLVALVAVALGLIFSRRHAARIVVPDTIAELDEEPSELVPR